MGNERIVIFDASRSGKLYLERYGADFEVLVFSNNDVGRHGTTFCALPVIHPRDIRNLAFDSIVVGSVHAIAIRETLARNYGLTGSSVREASKAGISPNKSIKPFTHEATRELARNIILLVVEKLDQAGIPYFLDHGTLLGLVRDGDIIPWDDDIDIPVPEKFIEQTVGLMKSRLAELPIPHEVEWRVKVVGYGAGRTLGILIHADPPAGVELRRFATTIWFMLQKGDFIEQYINRSPAHYFEGWDELPFRGRSYHIPRQVDSYLSMHYINWSIPKQNIAWSDIKNYSDPRATFKVPSCRKLDQAAGKETHEQH